MNNNNNNKKNLISKILLWTFIANLLIASLFYLVWCLVDMQQEIRSLEAERNELMGKLEEIASYKEKNGQFQADLNTILEELIKNLENQ